MNFICATTATAVVRFSHHNSVSVTCVDQPKNRRGSSWARIL